MSAASIAARVLSNIRGNVLIVPIIESTSGQQHRRTRRPWPQPADGRCRPALSRCTPMLVCAHSCPYDLTYEATSRFFRTGEREQDQEDSRAPWVPRRPRISSGILSRIRVGACCPAYLLLSFTPLLSPPLASAPSILRRSQRSGRALTDTLRAPRELFPIRDCK